MRNRLLIAGGVAVLVAAILLFRIVHGSTQTAAAVVAQPSGVRTSGSLAASSAPTASVGTSADPSAVHGTPVEGTATPEGSPVAAAEGQARPPKPIIGEAETRADRQRFRASRRDEKRAWKLARKKDPTLRHAEFRRAWQNAQGEQTP